MAENPRQRHMAAVRGTGRRRRRLGVGTVVLVAASGAVLAGCGSGAPSAARGVSGTAGPVTDGASPPRSPGAGSAQVPAAASDAAPSRASAPGSGRCHTSDLKASVGRDDPGAGQENYALVLTNTSGRTCTVSGFPGFAFVDGTGRHVAPDPRRAGAPQGTVRLAPGHSAWAALGFPNPGIVGGATVTPAAVEITPPDEKAFLTVHWKGGPVSERPPSTATSHVGPFQPGTGPAAAPAR